MRNHIKELRTAIRYHRDQTGDDRCWLDDHLVWNLLPELKQDVDLPGYEEGMKKCTSFFKCRNAISLPEIPQNAILDPAKWNEDLPIMNDLQLIAELEKLKMAIKRHHDIQNRERTLEDDKELYAVLPEKIPADFRLPSEEDFLGTTRTNAGCPQFLKSHSQCAGKHKFDQWGPCR